MPLPGSAVSLPELRVDGSSEGLLGSKLWGYRWGGLGVAVRRAWKRQGVASMTCTAGTTTRRATGCTLAQQAVVWNCCLQAHVMLKPSSSIRYAGWLCVCWMQTAPRCAPSSPPCPTRQAQAAIVALIRWKSQLDTAHVDGRLRGCRALLNATSVHNLTCEASVSST